MNTKLYALLLTLLCATGGVHASEGKEGNNPGDNNQSRQQRRTRISLEELLSLLNSQPVGGNCADCGARISRFVPLNQDGSEPKTIFEQIDWIVGIRDRLSKGDFDTFSSEQSPRTLQSRPQEHSPRSGSVSPQAASEDKASSLGNLPDAPGVTLHMPQRPTRRSPRVRSQSHSPEHSPTHRSLSPKGSPSNKNEAASSSLSTNKTSD